MNRLDDLRAWADTNSRALERAGTTLMFVIPLLFLALAVARAAPFIDDVPVDSHEGDDWVTYKIWSDAILHGGLSAPSMGAYAGTVHGFIYNYFVAGIFWVFGENTAYVYVVQGLLLGASASLLYVAWRRALSPLAGLGLLLGGALVIYVDVFRNISSRLLSENLFLFLLTATLSLYVEAHRRPSWRASALAGLALGAAVLSRTSLLVASVGLLLASGAQAARRRAVWPVPAALVLGYVLAMGVLPARELAATGRPDVDLLAPRTADLNLPPTESAAAFVDHYARQALFTLGIANAIEPAYRIRPHWPVLWLGALAYGWWRIRGWWRAQALHIDVREQWVLLVLVLYLGPVLALSYPSNYGGRMVTVVLPLVLALGVVFVDECFIRTRSARDHASGAGFLTTRTT